MVASGARTTKKTAVFTLCKKISLGVVGIDGFLGLFTIDIDIVYFSFANKI